LEWAHVAIYLILVLAIGCGMSFGGYFFLSPTRPGVSKGETYECGVPLLAEAHERFSVRFYLVAIMFILFDIETVFLIPWAVLYQKLGVPGLFEVGIFFAVLGFGLAYLWKRGGLEWD
jgi:NADH-quinone oxidoreductase subunit A